MNWNVQMERKLQALRKEVAILEESRLGAVAVLDNLVTEMFGTDKHYHSDVMIGQADALRDALAPFDSGVRQGQKAALPPRGLELPTDAYWHEDHICFVSAKGVPWSPHFQKQWADRYLEFPKYKG